MLISRALNPRRIARSLITTLALTLIQTVGLPIIAPKLTAPASHAVTGSITAAGSTTRSFITIPAGVESITLTVTGAGGGKGGSDVNTGGKGGMAQRLVVSFAVTPGDVVSLFPGNAGATGASGASTNTGGTGNGGSVAGGASTVTDSYWNINGTSYQNPSFSGGASGKVGTSGSSGSGGGGGAASVVAINRNIVAVAGGAGGGGGAGSTGAGTSTNAGGTDGVDGNVANSNLMYGGVGKDSGAGLTCSAADGGSGGGGGGGYLGGTGGSTELVGTECSGRGGYRGNAYIYNALSSSNTSFDTSANPDSPLNGTITYSYDVKSPTTCTPTSTTVDIYTVLRFDASVNCTWTAPSTVSVIDIFAVGGGGGGGDDGGTGGGGGAGLLRTAIPITPSSALTIRAGYGGRGGLFNAWDSNYGETSSVTTSSNAVYSAPGGAGGGVRTTGKGAGGSAAVNGTFAGGAGGTYPSIGAIGGVGNYGISNYFYGSINSYAGGGGGGCYYDTYVNVTGAAGRNGGGAGCSNSVANGQSDAIAGDAGTGGGGGGGGAGATGRVQGGKGGSGVILIRYATNPLDSFPSSVASALAGRWTADGLQVLDSSRKGWIDSSGTYANVSITGTPTIGSQAPTDSGFTTGSTKSNLAVTGLSTDKVTFVAGTLSNYTLFHLERYQRSTVTPGRVVTASGGNYISGLYNFGNEGNAYRGSYWITPTGTATQYKWLLSTDMTKLYRANGKDLTYKADNGQVTQATGPTGLGINNYASEPGPWQVLDVFLFNRQLTVGEMRSMETYISRIYGLSLDTNFATSDTDTAATMGSASSNYYFFNSLGVGNTLNDTFTVEAWVKPTSTCDSAICQIVVKESTILFGIHSGYLYWALNGSNIGWNWTTTGIRIRPGEWSHVSMVKQFTGDKNGSLLFYLNGKLAFTQAASPYASATNYNSLSASYKVVDADDNWYLFGGRADQYFYGDIDEIKVWKIARTASEIAADMHSNDGSNPNMQMYYNFNMDANTYPDIDNTWVTPIVPNLAAGGVARSDLYTYYGSTYAPIENRVTDGPYTKITIPRTIITKNGGWKAPTNASKVQTLVVGGGGGGGGGYEGGGGGAGGFIETVTTLTPGGIYPVMVGYGGRGTSYPLTPTNGDTSTAFGLTALGGGSGSVEFNDSGSNRQYTNTAGGSGGGGSWSIYMTGASGTSGQGNNGGSSSNLETPQCGSGNIVFAGGGGGGAGAVGQDATCSKGGDGGAGRVSTVLGATVAAGGGGSLRPYSRTITSAVQGVGGTGGGGNSAYTDGAAVGASGGATNGTYSTGSGGGAGYAMNGYSGVGGSGGSGIVALRYITALVPSYTKPTNTYLNVGMTETFTTNVAVDSATAGLTRTFKWESTTPTANGAYTILKSGTGAANAAYSWVPSDTSTNGSGYLYRLTVTDSDTAGLFISDSSTAYAFINPALKVTAPAAGTNLAKKINVSRNETFTITLGTPTYKAILSPVIPGITIDTSTAGSVLLKIGDTATVGTWLETLTVTDSVSASVVIPLSITIAAPPTLLNTGEIVSNGMMLNLDAGNSQSLLLAESATATNAIWRDLSGNKKDASTGGVTATTYDGKTCTAPKYYSGNGGYIELNGSSDCFRTEDLGMSIDKSFTVEAWYRSNGAMLAGASILSQNYSGSNIGIVLGGADGTSNIRVGIYNGTWRYSSTGHTPTVGVWTHYVGTFDGSSFKLYVNGALFDSTAWTGGLSATPNTTGYFIGRRWDGTTAYLNGSVGSVRVYNTPLTATQVLQNYNATKARFDASNNNLLTPSQKYGAKTLESFTATSGSETKTVTFTVGDRTGIDWDTTTVLNQINLAVQESITPSTYFDTMTVTDNLGQSTYLPFKFTINKADTLTVYVDTPTALNYTGDKASFTQTVKTIGAVGLESGTALSPTVKFKPAGTTCATGGYCRVGDVGPAGGIIFIDTSTAFSDGRIYEAAPYNWTGSDDLASVATYCSNPNSTIGTAVGIGQGETNTTKSITACLGGAVAKVNAYNQSNTTGYSNWFIPSTNESAPMMAVADKLGLIGVGSNWSTGTLGYWTSTESTSQIMFTMKKTGASFTADNAWKSDSTGVMVRPVRAFKSCWAIDTCTALATTDTPTAAGVYNIVPSALANSADLLTKYTNVVYSTTNLTINKVAPTALVIPWINTNYPDTFTVNISIRSGTGNLTYTTTNGTATGCALDYKKLYTTSQGTCNVTIARAADRNFLADTVTATVFFLAWVNSQPTNQVGSGSTIALNGATSYSIDTTTPPSISSLSTTLLSLGSGGTFTINGTGFGANGLTVKFWRNKVVTPSGSTATTITFNVSDIGSAGASTGRITVITVNGQDFSTDTLTITP